MNFGASFKADYERYRGDKGTIYPHAAPVNMVHLEQLVDHMHMVIEHSPELSYFRSFFFDSWCRGIKTTLNQDIEHSITDVEWGLADHANTFIDVAIEAIPSHRVPTIGLPKGYVAGSSNTLLQSFFFIPDRNRIARHEYRYVFTLLHPSSLTVLSYHHVAMTHSFISRTLVVGLHTLLVVLLQIILAVYQCRYIASLRLAFTSTGQARIVMVSLSLLMLSIAMITQDSL